MKTNHLYLISVIVIVLSVSCRSQTLYDIAAPQIVFTRLLANNNFLVQFNEPVKQFQYMIEDTLHSVDIKFPKSNIEISKDEFAKCQNQKISVTAKDTSNHQGQYVFTTPKINDKPSNLVIDRLQLKYSAKSPQTLVMKSLNNGLTIGYKLVLFVNNSFVTLPFDDLTVKANEQILLQFVPNETEYNQFTISKKQNVVSFNRFRLSPTCSCVIILNNHDEIIDSIFYIDTKKNDITYFETKNRAYKHITQYMQDNEISLKRFDVIGNTIGKPIVRENAGYIVKEQKLILTKRKK